MKNTIYITPSNEQLVNFAKEDPQFYESIRTEVLSKIKESAINFTNRRIESQANSAYESLYKDIEKKMFIKGDYWKGIPAQFSDSLKDKFSKEIETTLHAQFEQELQDYLNSSAFKSDLKMKIRNQVLTLALKNLDGQIAAEAAKLTA